MRISFFEVGNDEEARFREEFKNDEVAQKEISEGLKEFLNEIIDEQVRIFAPSNPFDKFKSIFVKSR